MQILKYLYEIVIGLLMIRLLFEIVFNYGDTNIPILNCCSVTNDTIII